MNKRKNAQKKLINELKKQLLVQAERLGVRDLYTPLALEEMRLDALRKILTEFYLERSNLEYELNMIGSNKKELLIKLERLNVFILRAQVLLQQKLEFCQKLLDKACGDVADVRRAVKRIEIPAKVQAAA